jgi:SlyX protein
MSDELYSQQKVVSVLKKKISNFDKRIDDLENCNVKDMIMEDKKPPHY